MGRSKGAFAYTHTHTHTKYSYIINLLVFVKESSLLEDYCWKNYKLSP